MQLFALFLVFLLSGVLGWSVERTLFNNPCNKAFYRNHGICLPFLPLWAVSGALLFLLFNVLQGQHILVMALVAAAILTLLECGVGKLSSRRLWNYTEYPLSFCDGYNCAGVSAGWFAVAAVVFVVFGALKKYLPHSI
jgi:uncharacterized membrane protein